MSKIYNMYKTLYQTYGAQGWWPITVYGYHKLDYMFPRNKDEKFEVCLGSILTQNTTFTSVVKSLNNLHVKNALHVDRIERMDIDELKDAIRPSGYYNQKAEYILEFIKFYKTLNGETPTREALLHVKGIGEETADSMLLYGYNQLEFKVDAYTKRMLVHLGFVDERAKYAEIKSLMQNSLKKCIKDEKELLITYQEFHALIVEHGKKYYSKKPYGMGCFLPSHRVI
ncbi:MAG: endonuclease III [Sulfurimonas sp. RIFOXYD12_FULL_33_39]|uniref:endonuclease III domain-containing protein n=1 Tax=unclassified Sulfurimonas TaxID=2623549 RepID=UPI0008C29711|nr:MULTISPECIES: endonuclease III domain-containing protein [unclassified Sulfurimonas]OHE02832.1 MAG: endonuclease III [Sulfurimonas sp. RIFCSPLOWO2_12_FULL_34_6]OHE10408.1 MAG: endonuclease III [Sulfurimonas sp. RIFOXYD12_FULL_33_39]OHE14865.1 MAG: endonuclease III [Sulfurimonas sp. RIFOXYD2_FULL_34_21]DAB27894.1 MAG TPA: endonuclease III [Sulfurimonas sp. UBA10385]